MHFGTPAGPERTAKIIHLFRDENMSIQAIADRFHVSYWTVRNELLAVANPQGKKGKGSKANSWRSVAASPS